MHRFQINWLIIVQKVHHLKIWGLDSSEEHNQYFLTKHFQLSIYNSFFGCKYEFGRTFFFLRSPPPPPPDYLGHSAHTPGSFSMSLTITLFQVRSCESVYGLARLHVNSDHNTQLFTWQSHCAGWKLRLCNILYTYSHHEADCRYLLSGCRAFLSSFYSPL